MVQSVEVVLDAGLDAAIREEWTILLEADLPSQARHRGPSNAPHITLGIAEIIDAGPERGLSEIDYATGTTLRLGGLLVFHGRQSVLSRVVVPSARLLRMHHEVHAAVADMPGCRGSSAPDRWTPHVTLARRLDTAQLSAALALLADRPRELVGTIGGARRWDGDARMTWDLGRTA